MKYRCPCCFCETFDEPPGNTYLICPVCNWEDDKVQLNNPDMAGGANKQSLNEARRTYLERLIEKYKD